MKAVLMCSGIGKRMNPITGDKALLGFIGKSLVVHQINTAIEAGLNQFVILANQGNIDKLKSTVSGLKNIKIDFALQEKPLGMADALLAASALIAEEPFILVNSNDIFDASAYASLINEYETNDAYSAYLVARQVQTYFPGGYLVTDQDGEIRHIIEKPPRGKEPSNLINVVLHLHAQPEKLLDYVTMTGSASDDVYERALDRMICDGHKMKAVIYNGGWQAIKYPWHILDAMDYFANRLKQQISATSRISDKAVVDGEVVIEDNVRVLEGAVIRGPSYIGQNTVIGNSALVRDSFIGDDCVVGYGTEIKHSYIGNKCWFHSNYIGDSVIEGDCSFGAGAVTANFRLDEAPIRLKAGDDKVDTERHKLGAIVGRGCRIGINASLMPGIRVGADSSVGAHICLTRDLESGKKVLPRELRYRVLSNENKAIEDNRQELFKRLTG